MPSALVVSIVSATFIIASFSLFFLHYAQLNSIKFNVYQNDAYGIKIDYPDSWDKIDFSFGPLLVGFITTEENE